MVATIYDDHWSEGKIIALIDTPEGVDVRIKIEMNTLLRDLCFSGPRMAKAIFRISDRPPLQRILKIGEVD